MPDILDHYELLENIGSGGMGTVHRARDTRTGELVAIKILHPHLAADPDYLRRFSQEALLAAKLIHPNIVRILRDGEANGRRYMAMELVEGETLFDRLKREPKPDVAEVRSIARTVAAALQVAHNERVVHRDIKPANILLGRDGSVKVSDFGIARALDATAQTRTGMFLGSVTYTAPEALAGRADFRSDLYSLGILLYQCLLGHAPFAADTPLGVLRMHERETPPDLAQLREMDEVLGRIIARLLEKDPDDRYQSSGHLLRALDGDGSTGELEMPAGDAPPRRGAPVLLLGLGAAAVIAAAAVGAVAFVLAGGGDDDAAGANPPTQPALSAAARTQTVTAGATSGTAQADATRNAAALQTIAAAPSVTPAPPQPTQAPAPTQAPPPPAPSPVPPQPQPTSVVPPPPPPPPSVFVGRLSITANPAVIACNGSSTSLITATVQNESGGSVPDGTTVTFSVPGGNASPSSVGTSGGRASSNVSINSSGGATVSVSAGGVIANIRIDCN